MRGGVLESRDVCRWVEVGHRRGGGLVEDGGDPGELNVIEGRLYRFG